MQSQNTISAIEKAKLMKAAVALHDSDSEKGLYIYNRALEAVLRKEIWIDPGDLNYKRWPN